MSEKEKIPEKTAYHLASVMLCQRFWPQVKCAGGKSMCCLVPRTVESDGVYFHFQPNDLGMGVVGVVQVDFLKPIHNKQDFEKDEKYK